MGGQGGDIMYLTPMCDMFRKPLSRPSVAMVDLPGTMVDSPNTMVYLHNSMVDLPYTLVDLPNFSLLVDFLLLLYLYKCCRMNLSF